MTDPVPGLLSQYDISPQEKEAIQKQNFWRALLQTGMGLMAAGSPVSNAQRAQLLMQAAQPIANMGAMNQAMMQSASREKLNMAAAQRLAQQDQAAADIRKMADDPSFQESLGVLNPAMRAIIQADLKLGKTDSARAFLTPRRTEVPSGYRVAGDGLEAIPGGPADPTVTERLAAAKRAQQDQATAEIRKMADDPSFQEQLAGLNPAQRALVTASIKKGDITPALSFLTPRRGEVPSGYRVAGDGLEAIPGGPADPTVTERLAAAKRAQNEKAVPQTVTKGMNENLTSLRKIDDTLAELDKNPDSVGGVGSTIAANIPFVGDLQNKGIMGTGDPAGTKLRALIADIGSLKVHDRSGANVTASETPRLRPFIPSISDDAVTVRKKLENFRTEYLRQLEDAAGYYNADNGFKPYKPADDYLAGRSQPSASGLPQPGDIIDGYRYKGGNRADKNNWERAQ